MKLISHKSFLKHKLPGHVESPERIKLVLDKYKYEDAPNGDIHLHKVHDSGYIKSVQKACAEGMRFLDAGDTFCVKGSYTVACYAVGAAVKAADYALKGQNAFALVRPPGHHAHPSWTGGFCLFNNVAIAAAYCAEKGKRVLIVDIDIHRGDGTQECVMDLNKEFDGKLFYLSFNQQGIFPGASLDEGKIYNHYFEPGTSEDDYLKVLLEKMAHYMRTHKPDVIAISAGFDAFAKDQENYNETLGLGLNLTSKTIKHLVKICDGVPFFAVLEGGYDPESVLEGVSAFMARSKTDIGKAKKKTVKKKAVKKTTKKKTDKKKSPKPKKKAVKKKAVKKKATKKKTVKRKKK